MDSDKQTNGLSKAFADVYNWLVPLAAINMLWLVLSMTIVLLPPATAGLYVIALRAAKGRGPEVREYISAVRPWFVKSWQWGLPSLLVAVASPVALRFYWLQETPLGRIFLLFSVIIIIMISSVQFYFWPYVLIQDQPHLMTAGRNASFTVLANPLRTAKHLLTALALLFISVTLVIPFVVITPTLIAFMSTYSLHDWLRSQEKLPPY